MPQFPQARSMLPAGSITGSKVEFSTLVRFSRLVSDSPTSESVFALLGHTVVEKCRAFHAMVFGTTANGDFTILSSHGGCDLDPQSIDLDGVCSAGELRTAVMTTWGSRNYGFRFFPLISDSGLFGVLVVVYLESSPLNDAQWTFIEALNELTAISFNKT